MRYYHPTTLRNESHPELYRTVTKVTKLLDYITYKIYNDLTFIWKQTEVSRLGTDRSSMEIILWTCIEAQKLINNVRTSKVPNEIKAELIQIHKEHSPKTCKFIDAKAD